MERRQFIQLMDSNIPQDKESIALLQDFVTRFPYCQTGHLLLAKCLHDQQNILFDQQLKTAAAYVADRKVLYELIHRQKNKSEENEPPVFRESPVIPFSTTVLMEEENSFARPGSDLENVFIETHSNENVFKETFSVSEMESSEGAGIETSNTQTDDLDGKHEEYRIHVPPVDETTVDRMEEKNLDPHEVIRKRLSEILRAHEKDDSKNPVSNTRHPIHDVHEIKDKESENKNLREENQPAIELKDQPQPIPDTSSPLKSEEEKIISLEIKNVRDVVDKIGLEHALEESIIHSIEKFPIINPEEQKKKRARTEASVLPQENADFGVHSFLGWLRIKAGTDFGKVEEVHSEHVAPSEVEDGTIEIHDRLPSIVTKEELITQFIATEPRIVPSKAEFYSPVSQAKKSIHDDEDIVSETLAKIYLNQGNLLKARSSFKKLSLHHPEKSNYFAALIQEIDNLLNKQE